MPIEVEIKLKIESLSDVEFLLLEKKAHLQAIVSQRDIYFAHPERDFGRTDEALRIREEGDKCLLTYKGPKLDLQSKTRLELETIINDALTMGQILEKLGFQQMLVVQKERRIYQLGQITIALDILESLGTFLEIEQIIDNEEEYETIREQLFDFLTTLGLNPEENIRKSYLELLLEKQAQNENK
ncbi:MAG: class IV adenylate cyclase [Candidatus Heimdallarchaeota archaeon]